MPHYEILAPAMDKLGPILLVLAAFGLFSWFWWGPFRRWVFEYDNPHLYREHLNPEPEAMTFHTGECQDCGWKIVGVPFRRYESALESHSRMTQHLDYFGDAQVIVEVEHQASPPPAKRH